MSPFSGWVNRTETSTQVAERWPVMGLCAALDRSDVPDMGEPIPLAAHWVYFTPMVPQSQIGFDGHPERKGLIPPIVQPRRMWAASDISFLSAIHIGDRLTKTARVHDISEKQGASGPLLFLQIDNRYSVDGREVLSEIQTLVYRDHPKENEAAPPLKKAPDQPLWSDEIHPDPTLLFRYSAVTFNAHRIHYDHPYATGEEGYPGVIVQGQLIATLMLDRFRKHHPEVGVRSFNFRAVKPLFAGQLLFVEAAGHGDTGFEVWARDADGALLMTAKLGVSASPGEG